MDDTTTKRSNRFLSRRRDWSEIPMDLLHTIAKKLQELSDFVRFRMVCQQWRSSCFISDPPLQTPWIIPRGLDKLRRAISVHLWCNSSSGIVNIDSDESRHIHLMGSWHGYLLTLDRSNSSLSLIDPLVMREIPFPRLDIKWCNLLCIETDPIADDKYVAIHAQHEQGQSMLCVCRMGDDGWKTMALNGGGNHSRPVNTESFTYFNGMFFVQYLITEDTNAFDATTCSLIYVIPCAQHTRSSEVSFPKSLSYFVQSNGKLLRITTINGCEDFYGKPTDNYYLIHELDFGTENPRWIHTKNIGDQFLLLDSSDYPSLNGLSLNARDFPGFKGNCIYYLGYSIPIDGSRVVSYLVRYDIKDGRVEELPFSR